MNSRCDLHIKSTWYTQILHYFTQRAHRIEGGAEIVLIDVRIVLKGRHPLHRHHLNGTLADGRDRVYCA